ncbi:MAG: DegT/DnrJ/EryC1/StrS family aminotransferase [Deltaproteobacteria bacterium]|nr:DegT/DnrJ/EryC1/StrS family aminotransferase [Deltaproteobacteria bacterium]
MSETSENETGRAKASAANGADESAGGKASRNGRLAIFGGKKAVQKKAKEKWRKVTLREIGTVLYSGLRDVNTVSDGGGPLRQFEKKFAEMCGTKYAIVMNSGTATLHSAYFATGCGPGDEVIVPAYTFFASSTPILQVGATPVFCDVDEKTLIADPAHVERLITPRTRAICVVHVWGNPGKMDAFLDIARRHRVALIEDASHAPGASYAGRPVGSWGDIGCFSLQGAKAVSGGECGVAVTDDPDLYDRMLALGHNGRTGRGQVNGTFEGLDNVSFGLKYRPHVYGVILALGGLDRLGELNELRRRNYRILEEELRGCPGIQPVGTYEEAERGGFLNFILNFDPKQCGDWSREAFVQAAKAEGVPLSVDRYTQFGNRWALLPDSPMFTTMETKGLGGPMGIALDNYRKNPAPELPNTRKLVTRLVSLPAFAKVPPEYVRDCARALRKVAEAAPGVRDFRDI